MAIPADTLTLKKITLVKQIYYRGIRYSKSSNPADRIISVILYDLSNETMLNTIISSIDTTKTPADNFPPLLNQVESLLSIKNLGVIADRSNILRLHNIRNDAQHDARVPSENDQSDCVTHCRDFLRNITKQVWDLDFDKISLADLVNNVEIKQYLIDAENSMKISDYKKSVEKSAIALEQSLNMVSKAVVGRAPYFDNQIVVTDAFGRDLKASREYSESIENMRRTLAFLALNIDYMNYLQFKKISGNPIWTIGSKDPHSFHGQKENITESDAEFILSFAVNSILSIEGTVGDLKKPFGEELF